MAAHTERQQVSSGGVIVRQQDGQWQLCLITTRRQHGLVWGLPKGHIEAGEDEQTAAVREVREETGLVGTPITKLGSIAYSFREHDASVTYFKTVHFYFLRYLEGDPDHHGDEVQSARWLSLDDALQRLTYENERRIVLQAKQYLTTHQTLSHQQAPNST